MTAQIRPRGRPRGVRKRPRVPRQDERRVMIPFASIEGVDVATAARWAGVTPKTMRTWAIDHALGRLIGGRYVLSRLAVAMFVEGDHDALALYHAGDRSSDRVMAFYDHMLRPLGITAAIRK